MKQIITIAREYGSGGRLIGQRVADELAIPCYDRKLIELAASETGLTEEYVEEQEQKKTPSFLYNLYISSRQLPMPDQVFVAQTAIIKRLAEEGPCVIVGRCGDYILRDTPNALHVFVHAPAQERILRAQERYGEAPDVAHMMVARQDKSRASYYNHFTGLEWGHSQNYHLSISSSLGIENVVRAIVGLARGREDALMPQADEVIPPPRS